MSGCRHEADWIPLAEVGPDEMLTGDTSVMCNACHEWIVAPCMCRNRCSPERRVENRERALAAKKAIS